MKILHINSYYANRFFYKKLLEEQERKGNTVLTIIPAEYGFTENFEYGNNTIILRSYSKWLRFIYPVRFYKILKSIEKNIDINAYDLIQAHSLFTNGYLASVLAKKYNIPYYVTLRNVDVNTFFKRIIPIRSFGRRIIMNAEEVFFLSKAYRDIVVKRYCPDLNNKKCSVIPNGIDKFWIDNRNDSRKLVNNKEIRFIYAGEINKNKNIEISAKSISEIEKKGYKVSFCVIGRKLDDAVIINLKKYSFISILEPVEKEKLIEFYRNADIYIMPSHTESFGLTYVEAMSQGLPVIYTKNQGFDGQFEEGIVGYHVNENDVDDIVDKIEKILKDYEAISSRCIIKSVFFSWSNITDIYLEKYQNTKKYRKLI